MVKPAIFIDFYIQAILGQKLLKIAIVHCAIGKLENNQVLSFFNQDSVIWKITGFDAADFFKQNKQ